MFKLYYAAAIDTCVDEAVRKIVEIKEILTPYTIPFEYSCVIIPKPEDFDYSKLVYHNGVAHPIEVYGAGFGESPIIGPTSSILYKGAVSAYDFRKIRECDILLVVTDLKQFAAGTMMELEYARQLGIYTIIFVTSKSKVKNIFLETYANKIIYSKEELIEILKDLTK